MSGRLPLCLAVSLVACGSGAKVGFSDASNADSGLGTATIESGSTLTPAPSEDPVWQHLDANFPIVAGVPDAATSTVTVTLYAEGGAALCVHTAPVLAVTEQPRPTPDLLGWWRVDLGDGVPDEECAEYPARTVWMGVAPYDAALAPAALAGGYSEATANAAVVRFAEVDPVWLAGLAGTEAQLAGYAPAPTMRPIPDGDLWWVGLFLLPL